MSASEYRRQLIEKVHRDLGYAPVPLVARERFMELVQLLETAPPSPRPCTGCGGLAGECPPGQGCRYEP